MGQSAVHWRRSITGPSTFVRMMEKMLMNMVQKAIAKQQAAENQMAIDNNNRLGTKDIENADNECNQENTDCEFEWQSRLLLLGQKDKVEKWRLEQIPEIQREDMAANFLFKSGSNSNIPRWKFELGL